MKKIVLYLLLFITGIQLSAANYYWVGGSGNWSDFGNHWATTSGGDVFHTTAPTLSDHVFFDENSFAEAGAIVTINVDAVCANMDWSAATNNPQLSGATNRNLRVHGSFTLTAEMNYNFLGNVFFLSLLPGTEITMAGQSLRRQVYFQGTGGWILQDPFVQTGNFTVFFENGTLNLNNQPVTLNIFDSYFTTVRTLLMGSSTFTITSGSNSAFRFRGDNFNFNAGASTIVFTGSGPGINHVSNQGNGLAFNDVLFENTATGSSVSNQNGSFNTLTFNGNGTLSNGNTIQTLTFNANGTINHNNNHITNLAGHGIVTINGNGEYENITFHNNGTITGNNTIANMVLAPGKSYTLSAGSTQLITNQLTATGTCAEQISIQSGTAGNQANISKSSGTVSIAYSILKDINASGGATFVANNSVNLGNNSGWTINQPGPLNLYWVGGTGDWNDPQNWSLASGGTGGACVPSPLDNVFFDANSFSGSGQIVTLTADGTNAVNCRNMNWAGVQHNPTIAGPSQIRLNIHGSLALNPNITYDIAGEVHFVGNTTGNTIFTAGRQLDKNHMYFNGLGEWTLLDGLHIGTRTLYLVQGTLNTNNQAVNAGLLQSWYANNVRSLILGSSEITLTSNSNSTVYIHGNNMTLDAGTSLIKLTAAGSGMSNWTGGGLFFHDLICEATTGTIDIYNLNGGFNTVIFNSTGTSRLRNSNTVDSVYFAGTGGIFDNNNNISKLVFNANATISGSNSTYGTVTVGGNATFSGNNTYGDVSITGEASIGGNNTYGSLNLESNASISGNNTIGKLQFAAGNQYTITNGRTQTILDDFIADGTETELIIIRSGSAGNQTTFSKVSGTLTLDYTSLRDLNATGGAEFIANNSFDLGNNTGWIINSPAGKDYFWVGGTGSWNDITNWALTSGGEGGAGIPSMLDNVVFDANSFSEPGQIVTIVGDAANDVLCLNMNWTGALHQPTLAGASGNALRIHGSLTMIEDMVWDFAGTIHMQSVETGNTFTTAGIPLNKNHLYFHGNGGEWTLQDDLNLGTRTLYMVQGSLITNDKKINAGLLQSWYADNVRSLTLGSSEITLTSTSNSTVYIHGSNMTLDAGTSLIRLTGAGSGMSNWTGGGLFFHDLICEATTGTIDIYNLNGGFNTIIFNSTGTSRLRSGNTVDSVFFAGTGGVYENNNNINKVIFSANATISGSNSTYGTIHIPGDANFSGNNTYGEVTISGGASIGGNSTWESISIGGNATITGNNAFGTLQFSAGNQYTITNGRVQYILDDFIADGTETELIIIRSSTAGSQTTFSKESGTITLDYISLRDLNATGGAEFIANNSFDLGNNTGWIINSPAGKDYYWVGGTGSWDEITNWALTSGGAGGAGIPSMLDNVFFDVNSFSATGQTVTLVGDAANDVLCLNMDWTGALHQPTLAGASGNALRIHGSLTLLEDMVWDFAGTIHMQSEETGNTFTTAGIPLNKNHLYFHGNGGEWTLQDDLNMGTRTLFLVRGSLITNNKKINAGLLQSWYANNERSLTLGSSEITLTSTSNSTVYIHGNNMTLDAGTSLIRLTGAGSGMSNWTGGGLFFHDLICEATTGTIDIYNINGGFNTVIFNSTGTSRLRNGNTVDSVYFAGSGGIYDNNNNINKLVFDSDAILSGNGTYGHIIMNNNGSITGNNTINILEFTPGNIYTITNTRTQTILEDIVAEGTCFAGITIQSSSATSHTTLSKAEGAVTISQASMQGINATGGAEFFAENSVNMGNNTGWTFTQAPQNLYWVGGTGDWNDAQNWAAESGGPGGYCVPTQLDNVIFDEHSFSQEGQAVFINVANARSRDMDWSAALFSPTFTAYASTYNLRIYGSLALHPEMNFSFAGNVYFEGELIEGEEETFHISMAGKSFNNHVYFVSQGGKWTLEDNFSAGNNDLYLNFGTINTNDKTLSCRRFFSNNNNIRALELGASILNISSNNTTSAWNVSGSNFTINPGTSEIRLTTANAGFLSTGVSELTYHKVVFQNPGGSSTLNSNHSFEAVVYNPAGRLIGGGSFNNIDFLASGEIDGNHSFGKATFFNNGIIKGTNSFETLKLIAGRTIQLESGRTQTLTDDLEFWGTSADPIYLQSTNQGVQATILKESGSVAGNYIHLRDMNATGGAEFIVYNSQDVDNNTGWSFLEPPFATCPDNMSICENVEPFVLNMALPAGGQYSGDGVFYDAANEVYMFDPSVVATNQTVITYQTPFESTCDFIITILPLPEITCREDIEVLARSAFITLFEGFGTYSYNEQTITGFNPDTEGTFTITYTVSNDCGDVSCEFLIIVGPPIIVEIAGDLEICEGETTILTASEVGTYLWSTGEETQSITVNESGVYSVTVTFEDNYQSHAEVTVTVFSLPVVVISGDLAFCNEDPILLTAIQGESYLWNTGETQQSITVTQPGEYSVVVSDSNGCVGEGEINVSPFPGITGPVEALSPPDNTYGINDPITFSWTAAESAWSYDLYIWRSNQPKPVNPTVPGITTTSHNHTTYLNKNYIYNWQVVANNFCSSTQSSVMLFSFQVFTDLIVDTVITPENAIAGDTLDVTFTVSNIGTVSTGIIPWKDDIYVSALPDFNPNTATKLSSVNNISALAPDQSYSNTVGVVLPYNLEGEYYIFIKTDAANNIPETNEGNNVTGTELPVLIQLPPYPDFAVSSVQSLSGNIVPGESLTVSWEIENIGEAPAIGGWGQRIAIISGTKTQILGFVQNSDTLQPSMTISQSANFNITNHPGMDGDVYLEIRLTPNPGLIEKPNATANNTALSEEPVLFEKRLFISLSQPTLNEDATTPLQGMIYRSGARELPLTVNINVSEENRITYPETRTIGAGQAGIAFSATAIDNDLIEGDIDLEIVAQADSYPDATTSLTIIDDEIPTLLLEMNVSEATEGETFQLTVTRQHVTNSPLNVVLSTAKPHQISLPQSVEIDANQASVTIDVEVIDDNIPEIDEDVTINASAVGFLPVSAMIRILDNDLPELTLTIDPSTISEGGGAYATFGTVKIAEPAANNITVVISANIPGQVFFPTQVTIPKGSVQQQFNIGAVNNNILDGDRDVEITASVFLSSCGCSAPVETTASSTHIITIIDNDGPTLSASAKPFVVPENIPNAGVLTIERNTLGGDEISVNISHNGPSVLDIPATAIIPEGTTSVNVPFSTLDDGIDAGDQMITISVSADEYSPGSCWIQVKDQNLPDFVIRSIAVSQSSILINDPVDISLYVANEGFSVGAQGAEVKIYRSTVNRITGSSVLLATLYTQNTIKVGDSLVMNFNYVPSDNVGDFYIIANVNAGGALKELTGINNTSEAVPLSIMPDYRATASVDGTVFNGTSPITITGFTQTVAKSPVPNKPVDVYIMVNGSRRVLKTKSDEKGAFSISFIPVNGEAGAYSIGACYPGQNSTEVQDEFTILGAKHTLSGFIKWDVNLDQPKQFTLPIQNLSSLELNNLQLEVISAPSGVSVSHTTIAQLGGNSTVNMSYTVDPSEVTIGRNYLEVKLRLTSSQGTIYRFSTWVYSQASKGNLKLEPVRLAKTMVRNETNYVEFDVLNNGMDETGVISIMIPQNNWMSLAGASTIPSLLPGQRSAITLMLTPGEDLQLHNPISGQIAINATNASGVLLPFTFEPVSSQLGNLLVDVVNEYTYNTAEAPHLEGATVVVSHPYTGQIIAQGTTNSSGHFLVEDIAEGYYNIRVRAPRHESYQDLVYVEKGITNTEVVFIGFQAITYSWEVVPTLIQDQYEITLTTVFETNVPAPVVIMDMPDTIPFLNYGESFPFILTLSNHGLITAQNVEITFPVDEEYMFTANVNIIDILPHTAVQIPVVVQRKPPDKSDKSNISCTGLTIASYQFECGPNDQIRLARKSVYYQGRVCGTTGSGGHGSTVPWPIVYGGGGPGLAPAGGGRTSISGISQPAPYIQTKSGCDPCLVEFLNALWGCSPIPSTFPSFSKNEKGFWGSASNAAKNAKKLKDLLGKLTCAFDIGWSIGCKIGQGLGLKEEDLKNVPQELVVARKDMLMAEKGFAAIENMGRELFNNEDLLVKQDIYLFVDHIQEFLDESKPITEDDQNDLMIALANTEITILDITDFASRWNQTVEAWNLGVFSPTTEYPNIIDTLLLHTYELELDTAMVYANDRGYVYLEEVYNAAFAIVEGYTEQTSNAICATVTVQFSQTLTMTREAFEGTLTIFNGHESDAMQNIHLDLEIRDENGQIKTHLFQINTDALHQITGIDGSGSLNAQTEGSAVVIFIPDRNAAPEVPRYYSFGGTLSYIDPFTGELFSQSLFPVTLQVNPSPDLHIDYFVQRDILGDDPFTEEIEPSIPAEMAVMIHNKGAGPAYEVNIESAQPRIIDNEKGLMIDFKIVGSNLGGKPTQLGLLNVDFGDLEGGEIAVGQWWFTSSLLGHFISYEVSVNHLNSFGNPDLSLVSSVKVHELIKSVLVYGPLNDSINDFLVNEIPDSEDTPDALYNSNGTVSPVHLAEQSETDGLVSFNNLAVQLTVTPYVSGWNYTKLDDPGNGRYRIVSCTREDGQEIPLDNIWLTHVTIPDGGMPVYEHKLHFLDLFEDGTPFSYVVVFEPLETDIPEVVAINGIPENITDTPVTNVQVLFNKPIDPETFDYRDMILRNQGGPDLMDASVTVAQVSDKLFDVDISSKTSLNGFYSLTVQAAGIADLEGVYGQVGKQATWIQALSVPAISQFFGLPDTPGEPIDEFLVLFNMPIVASTFTTDQLVLTHGNGEPVSTESLVITSEDSNSTLFKISGLMPLTSQDGYYELMFKVTDIQGETGEFGLFDQPAQWAVCQQSQPMVAAGDNITICLDGTASLLATADYYSQLLWATSGDGTFDYTDILNPVYTPGFNDILTGEVELCITAISSFCATEATDCMTIFVNSPPEVSCPDELTVSILQLPFVLSGSVPNGGIYSGEGISEGNIFSPETAGLGLHSITYTYHDEICGKVSCEFNIIVTDGHIPCLDAEISNFPTSADDVCEGEAYSLDFSSVFIENALGIEWIIEPSKAGEMNGRVFHLHKDYSGSVTITLSVVAMTPCTDVTASVSFNVNPLPVVEINGETAICQGQSTQLTANKGVGYEWSTGDDTQSITVSEPGTYHVYVTVENGCIGFAEVVVTMLQSLTVVTNEVTDINPESAVSGGDITSNCALTMVNSRGVVWSASAMPSVENNNGSTNDGTGLGEYESHITGLTPETLYHVRAYAISAVDTIYGEQVVFTTARATYTIAATAGQNGTIDPVGNIQVDFGKSQIFNIIPDANYRVSELWIDGENMGPLESYAFENVVADHTLHAEFEPITSITNAIILAEHIKIFPNPADDKIFIEFDGYFSQLLEPRYRIFDFTGKLIGEDILHDASSVINISSLLPGVYFVRIFQDDQFLKLEKIVKLE